MLRCEAVCFAVEPQDGAVKRTLLDDVSFALSPGSITWLQGPSGAGKSTLLSILAGMRRPTSGQVLFEGRAVSRFTAPHRDHYRQQLGFLPQRLHLFEPLSVLENVLMPLFARGGEKTFALGPGPELLQSLGLTSRQHQPVHQLSGGERQRVAFARAYLSSQRLLLLDEPTAHQDAQTSRVILGWLEKARSQGTCVLLAAHDPRVPELLPIDQALSLQDGRLFPLEKAP